ncbi:unnamed protein product [Mycena citricolor]|uniref:Uncharacterized protein n=1 Tax=Mycena citricolor TaxID=2018698 RepID=A0AAD2K2C3_9AGAR|nr:unnamed protein product [Mycena citricolor]
MAIVLIVPIVLCLLLRALLFLYHINSGAWQGESPTLGTDEGDRTLGKSFLHSVKQYWRLLPEAFFVNGVVAEEKVVRFALSYMSKDSAASWSERMSERTPFPFPTWALFVTEFKLRFVEENEQDHALARLETHQYYMGSRC